MDGCRGETGNILPIWFSSNLFLPNFSLFLNCLSPLFPFIVFVFSDLLYVFILFYFIFCIRLILYSRSSTAIVPTVVPDDVDASQSSQPAVLIGALESANRRQCLFVSFVYSGSWRPTCLQLQVGEPKRGRREPFLVMFLLRNVHLDNEMTFSNSGFRSLRSLVNGFWHEAKTKTKWT